jgi:hypothetical protein
MSPSKGTLRTRPLLYTPRPPLVHQKRSQELAIPQHLPAGWQTLAVAVLVYKQSSFGMCESHG